jgi:hypothetical protein
MQTTFQDPGLGCKEQVVAQGGGFRLQLAVGLDMQLRQFSFDLLAPRFNCDLGLLPEIADLSLTLTLQGYF